jgi:hypothetical protein
MGIKPSTVRAAIWLVYTPRRVAACSQTTPGMADELTNYVSCRLGCNGTPSVNKFIPYGKLEDVSAYYQTRKLLINLLFKGHALS